MTIVTRLAINPGLREDVALEGDERRVKGRVMGRESCWGMGSSDGDDGLLGPKSLGAIVEEIQKVDGEGRGKVIEWLGVGGGIQPRGSGPR